MVAASCTYGCSLDHLWLQGRRRARWCRADADNRHLHPYCCQPLRETDSNVALSRGDASDGRRVRRVVGVATWFG